MPRYQVQDLRNSRAPSALGICPTDDRFLLWLNEAEERLLAHGRWWGAIKLVQFCIYDGTLVFPRNVATLEQLALCGTPRPIESLWYQFTQNIARVQQCSSCGCCDNDGTSSDCTSGCNPCFQCANGHYQMRMQNDVASFSQTVGSNKVIRAYPTDASDVGKTLTIYGNDSNNIPVRTKPGGVWQDGETITLALPFVDTATVWYPGSPLAVSRQATNQRVLLYEYDTVKAVERQIGIYAPTETRPLYRAAFIPNFSQIKCSTCDCLDASGNTLRTVNGIAKLQHIDYTDDADFLIFENLIAYKEAMLAVRDWENGDLGGGNFHFYGTQAAPKSARGPLRVVNRAGAIPMLAAELRAMSSDRTDLTVQFETDNSFPAAMAGFI